MCVFSIHSLESQYAQRRLRTDKIVYTPTDKIFLIMLGFRTMDCDELKDDVKMQRYFKKEFDDVLHVCGFVRKKSALYRTLGL